MVIFAFDLKRKLKVTHGNTDYCNFLIWKDFHLTKNKKQRFLTPIVPSIEKNIQLRSQQARSQKIKQSGQMSWYSIAAQQLHSCRMAPPLREPNKQ